MADFLVLIVGQGVDELFGEDVAFLQEWILGGGLCRYGHGVALAHTARCEAVGADALGNQVFNDGLGALFGEFHIVLVRTTEVGVGTQLDGNVVIDLQNLNQYVKRKFGLFAEVSLVEVVLDVFELNNLNERREEDCGVEHGVFGETLCGLLADALEVTLVRCNEHIVSVFGELEGEFACAVALACHLAAVGAGHLHFCVVDGYAGFLVFTNALDGNFDGRQVESVDVVAARTLAVGREEAALEVAVEVDAEVVA